MEAIGHKMETFSNPFDSVSFCYVEPLSRSPHQAMLANGHCTAGMVHKIAHRMTSSLQSRKIACIPVNAGCGEVAGVRMGNIERSATTHHLLDRSRSSRLERCSALPQVSSRTVAIRRQLQAVSLVFARLLPPARHLQLPRGQTCMPRELLISGSTPQKMIAQSLGDRDVGPFARVFGKLRPASIASNSVFRRKRTCTEGELTCRDNENCGALAAASSGTAAAQRRLPIIRYNASTSCSPRSAEWARFGSKVIRLPRS
jgi:hypothetical protein